MTLTLLFSLILFAVITGITPGPNNIMLAASGTRFGFAQTLPHMSGVVVGFVFLTFLVGAGAGSLFTLYPQLREILKLLGSAYLLYLAWRLWQASAPDDNARSRPLRWIEAAGFQFLNPKAWLMAISAVSVFTLAGNAYWISLAVICGVFFLSGCMTSSVWAAFGAAIRRLVENPRALIIVNRGMAAATALCIPLLYI